MWSPVGGCRAQPLPIGCPEHATSFHLSPSHVLVWPLTHPASPSVVARWLALMIEQSSNDAGPYDTTKGHARDPEKDKALADENNAKDRESGNQVQVVVDDCDAIPVSIRWDRTVYGVADTMPHDEHTVEV